MEQAEKTEEKKSFGENLKNIGENNIKFFFKKGGLLKFAMANPWVIVICCWIIFLFLYIIVIVLY
jgi:hypothetical protein